MCLFVCSFVRSFYRSQAEDVRDAFAKMLYSRMFTWLVERMNVAIAGSVNAAKNSKFIGILDIFGFENFAVRAAPLCGMIGKHLGLTWLLT